MIRRLLRDFVLALVMVTAVSAVIYIYVGERLAESPVHAVSRWSRARAVSTRVSQLDGTVAAALSEMELQPEDLVEWQMENPESNLRRLWHMKPADQKNASVIALYILHQNNSISPMTAWREAISFVHYSRKYEVPLTLAVAVANTESHFDPGARSPYGAAGVMQVVWRVHSHLLRAHAGLRVEKDLHDPEKGISAGTLLLSRYIKAYGSTERALGRYYGGPVSRYWPKVARNMDRVISYGLEPGI
ncbi:MAG: transglycosylase SLT domain-containing protein [Thermovirgaceae bacterium]|nr:transglycosylase SLT domain-containing protein [Synergistales bacterium]MDI9392978.1 transglycosylase SLT domain-containing protein [Synergistota bacterium]NLV64633.1 lytic transglycosylase domain-containing protein [Synergistaceae bacterium]HRW86982.1 transglycosylase SLT domain-containing protein [Thermovirgaceae bacterium]MDD3829836.1 transglycosylase SLT domain-containing protein [Synergistales bacterium]